MSAPFEIDSDGLANLAAFMVSITLATINTGVRVDFYGEAAVVVDDTTIRIRWNADQEKYVIADRVGS